MRYGNVYWLWALFLIPLLILFMAWALASRRKAIEKFCSSPLITIIAAEFSPIRQRNKAILIIIGFALLIMGLANPQIGTKMITVHKTGLDVMIVFDVSTSMLAEDIPPNRLMSAKYALKEFVDKSKSDRIGLVAFAGTAFAQCPLTLDYGALKMFIDILDTALIPKQGTVIGDAVRTALKSFSKNEKKHKVILLFTDGEDHNTNPLEAAKQAKEEGVTLYVVGIGTETGVPIPVKNARGEITGYKKDRNGQTVMTKLDERTLLEMAAATGGKYFRAVNSEMAIDKIIEEISSMEKKELSTQHYAQYEDRFYYFIFAAFLCFAGELIISERKGGKA